jgi:hypothetical protein
LRLDSPEKWVDAVLGGVNSGRKKTVRPISKFDVKNTTKEVYNFYDDLVDSGRRRQHGCK